MWSQLRRSFSRRARAKTPNSINSSSGAIRSDAASIGSGAIRSGAARRRFTSTRAFWHTLGEKLIGQLLHDLKKVPTRARAQLANVANRISGAHATVASHFIPSTVIEPQSDNFEELLPGSLEDLSGTETGDPETLSSFPCEEGQFAEDQFRILNPNPISVAGAPVQLCLENRNRARVVIENCGTAVVYLGLGFSPTSIVYTKSLGACTANDDASGGTFIDVTWKGVIWAVTGGAGSKLQFTETNVD